MSAGKPFNPYEPPQADSECEPRKAFAVPASVGMIALGALSVLIGFVVSPADPLSMFVAIFALMTMGAVGFGLGRMVK